MGAKIQMNKMPDHFIPSNMKDMKWCLAFCKAIWDDYSVGENTSFYTDRAAYSRYMSYALGRQSVVKYQNLLRSDESDDLTFLNIDWTPLPIFTKFREIALARVKQVDYNVSATPIDPIAKEEQSKDKSRQASKIIGRKKLEQIAPDMVEGSPLQKMTGEFETIDELEVLHSTTYKHAAATQIEEAIEFVLGYNNFEETRAEMKRCIFDFGVGGIKEEVDVNGIVRLRSINPANLIISRCEKRDFSDANYIGEVICMSIQDIAQESGVEFTEEQMRMIESKAKNKFSSTHKERTTGTIYQRDRDDLEVDVMDIQWVSVDELIYETGVDKRGNKVASKSNRRRAERKKGSNHTVARYKTIYKAKWIIGTNFIWDYGRETFQKRKKSELQETEMSYHLFAPQFDGLTSRISSRVAQAIPVIDALHLAWFRLQGVIANARPKGISIEIGALEDVDLGVGQSQFTPYDVIDLYNKTGNLVYRRKDDSGVQSNYLPINELNNGIGDEANQYFALIQQNIQLLRDITGLNEVSEGFGGERTTNDVAQLANQSSNNALHGIIEADQSLLKRAYQSVLLRLSSIFQSKGGASPMYSQALGKDTTEFMKAMKSATSYEFGVLLENKPDIMERQRFLAKLEQFAGQGMLEPDDIFMVENTPSLKTAQAIIAYKIKKRKEQMQQQAQQEQQMAGQIQQQQIQMQMQMEQQRIQMETQAKLQIEQMKGEYAVKVAQINAGARTSGDSIKSNTAITKASMDNQSRERQTAASLSVAEKANEQKAKERSQSQKQNDRTRNQSNRK